MALKSAYVQLEFNKKRLSFYIFHDEHLTVHLTFLVFKRKELTFSFVEDKTRKRTQLDDNGIEL